MRRKRPDLQHYTWDQAEIMRFATSRGFRAVGIHDSTVRRWANNGTITAVGLAPGGAVLYSIDEVLAADEKSRAKRRRASA